MGPALWGAVAHPLLIYRLLGRGERGMMTQALDHRTTLRDPHLQARATGHHHMNCPPSPPSPQRALWALTIHLCSLKACWQINHNAAHQTLPTTIASIDLVLSMNCFRTPSQHHQSILGNIMQQVAGFNTKLRLWYECACACLCACTPRPSLRSHVTWKA